MAWYSGMQNLQFEEALKRLEEQKKRERMAMGLKNYANSLPATAGYVAGGLLGDALNRWFNRDNGNVYPNRQNINANESEHSLDQAMQEDDAGARSQLLGQFNFTDYDLRNKINNPQTESPLGLLGTTNLFDIGTPPPNANVNFNILDKYKIFF